MKKKISLFLNRNIKLLFCMFLPCVFLLSACWDHVEVNDLAVVRMMGLDVTEEDEIEITITLFLTASTSAQQQEGETTSESGVVTVNRSATGKTVGEAISKLQLMVSRKLFWGHAEVVIIGKELAEKGIDGPIELLLRHPDTRERAKMFISKYSAKEILELTPTIERSVAEQLREMARMEVGLNITLKKLAQMMVSKSKAAVLPYLDIKTKQKKQEPFPYIAGTAVIKEGKLIGFLDEATTRGVMWVRDELSTGTVSLTPEQSEGYVSFELLRSDTKLEPIIEGDEWSIHLKVHTLDDIIENMSNLDLSTPTHIEQLEKELGDDIRNRIYKATTEAQQNLNADIFQFADAFYRKYPKEWKENKERWDEIFPNVKVVVETDARISRPGMTSKSILNPHQE